MEPGYLRKFLALGLAGARTPIRLFVGKLVSVVLMFSSHHGPKLQLFWKKWWEFSDCVNEEYFASTIGGPTLPRQLRHSL